MPYRLLPLIFMTSLADQCEHWNYQNTADWPKLVCDVSNQCGSSMQSPVRILSGKTSSLLSQITFHGYGPTEIPLNLTEHHSIGGSLKGSFKNAALKTTFEARGFHFHTSAENQLGKTLDSLSAHIVHESEANTTSVVTILFKIGKENWVLKPITSGLTSNKSRVKFAGFQPLFEEMRRKTQDGYYQFLGSITTPPCTENVVWTIFTYEFEISQEQYDILFSIIGKSNRPTQRNLTDVDYFDPKTLYLSVGATVGLFSFFLTPIFVIIIGAILKARFC